MVTLLVVVVVFMLLPRTIPVKTDEGLALIKFDLDTGEFNQEVPGLKGFKGFLRGSKLKKDIQNNNSNN